MALGNIPSLVETCRTLSDPKLDGRYPGGPGHQVARAYLCEMLERLSFEPLFGGDWSQGLMSGGKPMGANLGGIKRGRSGRTLLLGAHYDHFQGVPGADDNAAALSILIEGSRILGEWDGEHSLVLCFFDLEEPPNFLTSTMGSVQFVQRPPLDLETIDCAMILDLCGHDVPLPGCEDAVFVLGAAYSPQLVGALGELKSDTITAYMFANERIGDLSDHHAFRLCGVPFLFFSCGRWEHYHRPTDTFEKLNLDKMQGLAEYLVNLVHVLDRTDVSIQPVQDFWRIEADSVRRLTSLPIPDNAPAVAAVIDGLLSQFSI